jgi:hypothetical protein
LHLLNRDRISVLCHAFTSAVSQRLINTHPTFFALAQISVSLKIFPSFFSFLFFSCFSCLFAKGQHALRRWGPSGEGRRQGLRRPRLCQRCWP